MLNPEATDVDKRKTNVTKKSKTFIFPDLF